MEFINNLLQSLKTSLKSFSKNPRSFITHDNILSIVFLIIIVMIVFSDSFLISLFIHSFILRLIWLAIAFWMIFKKGMITSGLLLLLLFIVALNTHSYIRVNKRTMEHYKDIGADPDDDQLADIESAGMTPPSTDETDSDDNNYTEDDILEMEEEEKRRKKEKQLKQKKRQPYATSKYETDAKKAKMMNAMNKEDFKNDRYLPASVQSKKIDDKFRILHEDFHRLEDMMNNMSN